MAKSSTNTSVSDWRQSVPFTCWHQCSVYRADLRFVYGALAANLPGVLGVLLLTWGWWQLGRAMSLNPLEVAQAFRAPLLAGAALSNSTRAEIARVSGAMYVCYGVVAARDVDEQFPQQMSTMPTGRLRTTKQLE
jgi:hypothetical protein